MSGGDVAAILGAVATGGISIGAGLYKLGNTLGSLTRAVQGFEARLELIEEQYAAPPRGQHVASYRAPYSSSPSGFHPDDFLDD